MRKFNVTVNGKSYVVDVEEVGSDGQVTPVISTVAAAPAPVAKPVAGDGTPVKAPMGTIIPSALILFKFSCERYAVSRAILFIFRLSSPSP